MYSESPIRVTLPIDLERARKQGKAKAASTKRPASGGSATTKAEAKTKTRPQAKPPASQPRNAERKTAALGNLLFPDGL